MMAVQWNRPRSAATWFILVNGGEKRAEDEANTRKELKKIYTVILEQKLAKSDHIVYFSGGQGMLSINPKLSHSYEGITGATLSAFLDCSESSEEIKSRYGQKEVHKMPEDLHVEDSAVIIFIGHGDDPSSWSVIPPSANGENASLGALAFVTREGKKSLYSPKLPKLKHTLFVSLACYSGNTFRKVLTGDQSRMMAVCLADPDHPASYDHILGQAFADFFKKDERKDQTIMQFCDYLQDKYLTHPYLLQMKRENLDQTEAEYELERKEAAEWAVKEFEGYLPRIIPHDLWRMFREVESLKKTIEDTKPDDLSQVARSKLSDHISKLEDMRFDLMRMYKHKPNNRFCLCGATDVIGQMTWGEFLHLPA